MVSFPRFDFHNHTDFSNIRILDSINTLEDLVNRAIEIGLSGIAITEHECLGNGINIEILQEKVEEEHPDFKIVHGNEIYLTDTREMGQKYYHFILLALDEIGYHMMCELSSTAWLNGYYDRGLMRVPTLKSEVEDIVKRYGQGHIHASTACVGGQLGSLVLKMNAAQEAGDKQGRKLAHDEIVNFVRWCVNVFGKDNFSIEVQPSRSHDQLIVNSILPNIAKVFDLPLCVTSDAHYLTKDDQAVHEAFLNSKQGDREVAEFYSATWLQTEEEILEHIEGTPIDYEQCCKNSIAILNKVQEFKLRRPQEVPEAPVPFKEKRHVESEKYPTLARLYESDSEQERFWVNECIDQLKNKNLYTDQYLSRLEEEADTMAYIGEKLDTCVFAYPLFMRHYIDLVWSCGSTLGCGRGSAGGGLSHWLLGITGTNPLVSGATWWRFLNKERVELPDIDVDLCPSRREAIFEETRKETGELGCVHVCTYAVLSTKAAIKCAARGYRSKQHPHGIPLEEAEYLSSLIPSERGFLWELKDVIEGNPDKGRKASSQFNGELTKYPGLKEILYKIEGLIVQAGIHASGIIYPPKEDYYRYGPFMRARNGTVMTQYSLHMAEAAGATKIDWLVTEVQEVITQCIQELQEHGYIEKELTLREAYDKYVSPDSIPLDDEKTWDAIDEANILKLFQLDSMIGRQGTRLIKPRSIEELTAVNALIRLMADEGEERPMDRYVRHKEHPEQWEQEMDEYGLTEDEKQILHEHLDSSYGVCYSQEQMMIALMDEKICGFTLKEGNQARKTVSKKLFDQVEALHNQIQEKATSPAMARYAWDIIVKPSLGYSFSQVHGYSYSIIGYQCAWLATHYPSVYWNTACLRVDSGVEDDASTSYEKISKAVGNIVNSGIQVSPIDINSSGYMFEPNEATQSILCGLKALVGVNGDTVAQIIENRPYSSFNDFHTRVPLNKTTMISLIKSHAFDCFAPREEIMTQYLMEQAEPKSKLTLANFQGLVDKRLIPGEYQLQARTFAFNKSLRANCKHGDYYLMEGRYYRFYEQFFDVDELEEVNGKLGISQKKWQKMYTKAMEPVKRFIADQQDILLDFFNDSLLKEQWSKYADGSGLAWDMDSLGFYVGGHELDGLNKDRYGISRFADLPEEPVVASKRGKFTTYQLTRICGTVVAKDDAKSLFTLLTTDSGSVDVKLPREVFALFNKKVVIEQNGQKLTEEGWFTRGTLLLVNGYRQGNMFRPKKYKNTASALVYKITPKAEGDFSMTSLRLGEDPENE